MRNINIPTAAEIFEPTPEPQAPEAVAWPTLDPTALFGLPGEIVGAVEAHTEADPVAILAQLLAAAGNAVGRGAWWEVESDRHHLALYVALVGETAKGRKGTSWGHIRKVMAAAEPSWKENCIASGLSSGEGLIWRIRDALNDDDPAPADKRLFVLEPELARVIRTARRDGNTLSPVIRAAWDGDTLRSLTKKDPAEAASGHISIAGHITRAELLRHLDDTEAGNGWANRFIWLCVRRARVLPEGGRFDAQTLSRLVERLRDGLQFGRTAGLLRKSEAARDAWAAVYAELSAGKPGLLGAVIGRAEAQVLRLAAVYAVLDRSPEIDRAHLEAALALWEYAEQSAHYIFGESLGDPLADEILKALKQAPDGMTRTELHHYFGRHKSAGQIARALETLIGQGLAAFEQVDTGGRPATVYRAVTL